VITEDTKRPEDYKRCTSPNGYERNLLQIPFNIETEINALKTLLKKYTDIPMSIADACLDRISEQISESVIFTIDSDFRIYRKDRRKIIPVIMP
jgi:hypothetical protein